MLVLLHGLAEEK